MSLALTALLLALIPTAAAALVVVWLGDGSLPLMLAVALPVTGPTIWAAMRMRKAGGR